MKHRWHAASVAAVITCLFGVMTASATASSSTPTSSSSTPNTADTEFVRMMIPHHYQALVMTRLAPERSSDDQVRSLARRINLEQGIEIDAMRGWQARNGLPVTDPVESYRRLLQDPDRLEEMGMATAEEIEELEAAQGRAFDVLFLELMIPHHEGAVTMAEQVIVDGRDIFVMQLATDIIATQTEQIDKMRRMLERITA